MRRGKRNGRGERRKKLSRKRGQASLGAKSARSARRDRRNAITQILLRQRHARAQRSLDVIIRLETLQSHLQT
jgi:hypothetical protein